MTFSFNNLAAAREPFDLGNGEMIFFRSAKSFDLQEYAAWQRLNRDFQGIAKQRQKASSEGQQAHVEKKNLSLCREMIGLVLPDLPSAMLDELQPGQVDRLAGMCIAVANGNYAMQALDAEQKRKIEAHYPELPEAFIQLLTRAQASALISDEFEEIVETEKNA